MAVVSRGSRGRDVRAAGGLVRELQAAGYSVTRTRGGRLRVSWPGLAMRPVFLSTRAGGKHPCAAENARALVQRERAKAEAAAASLQPPLPLAWAGFLGLGGSFALQQV